nr:hypothetical protein [Panacagrimonas sp.]
MEQTTESGADRLDALSQRLNRPVASLRAFNDLNAEELAVLCASLDAALSARQGALHHARVRLLPWPLHRFVLPWLRR